MHRYRWMFAAGLTAVATGVALLVAGTVVTRREARSTAPKPSEPLASGSMPDAPEPLGDDVVAPRLA